MRHPSRQKTTRRRQPRGIGAAPEGHFGPLQEKALRLLEFHHIQQRLANYASFAPGQELALGWRPAFHPAEVAELQAETAEAGYLLDVGSTPSLDGAQDVRPIAHRAARHGLLSGADLLAVADTLAVVRTLRNTLLRHRHHLPHLSDLADLLPSGEALEKEVRRCLDRRGEVVDDASPELKGARALARHAHERLHAALHHLVNSPLAQEVLQEPIVTLRGGRLVVPVRAERRRELPGLLHDTSDSGATLFMEPISTVDLGNDLQEAQALERREVERVLRRLSEEVAAQADDLRVAVDVGARLDLILARARYSRALEATPPQLLSRHQPHQVELVDARHPLLPGPVVPTSVAVGGDFSVLLITGPNTGGKTVTLKTIGLLALMAQAGLHLPAREARLSVLSAVYADIGDEQSIEHSISSFSSHIGNVVEALRHAGPGVLVLLDELGASTDPEEGAALAKAVLRALQRGGSLTVVTTHHRGVAALVQESPGMMNASLELDPQTFAPTYRLRMGLPGRSYALDIARRLGMPPQLLEEARGMVDQAQLHLEDLLREVQRQQEELTQKGQEMSQVQQEVEALRAALRARQEELEHRREELLEETRRELAERAARLARRLRRAERTLERAAPPQGVGQIQQEVREAQRELASPSWRPPPGETETWRDTLQPGDLVRVRGFYHSAQVLRPPDREAHTVEVLLGSLRMKLDLVHLESLERHAQESEGDARLRVSAPTPPPRREVHLRGLTVDEALGLLEGFLSDAVLAGLDKVRIVHGRGTGALRQAIRGRLARHPLVASHAPADPWEGGEGVTEVELT